MFVIFFDFLFEECSKLILWFDMFIDGEYLMGGVMFDEQECQVGLGECVQMFVEMFVEWVVKLVGENMDLIIMMVYDLVIVDMLSCFMEFMGNIMLLIVGGNDIIWNMISGGVMVFNEFFDQFEKLW